MSHDFLKHSLLIDICCNDTESPSHSHDFHQLILPVSGDLIIEIEGKQAKVDNNVIAYVSASNKHTFFAAQENRFIRSCSNERFLGSGCDGCASKCSTIITSV